MDAGRETTGADTSGIRAEVQALLSTLEHSLLRAREDGEKYRRESETLRKAAAALEGANAALQQELSRESETMRRLKGQLDRLCALAERDSLRAGVPAVEEKPAGTTAEEEPQTLEQEIAAFRRRVAEQLARPLRRDEPAAGTAASQDEPEETPPVPQAVAAVPAAGTEEKGEEEPEGGADTPDTPDTADTAVGDGTAADPKESDFGDAPGTADVASVAVPVPAAPRLSLVEQERRRIREEKARRAAHDEEASPKREENPSAEKAFGNGESMKESSAPAAAEKSPAELSAEGGDAALSVQEPTPFTAPVPGGESPAAFPARSTPAAARRRANVKELLEKYSRSPRP